MKSEDLPPGPTWSEAIAVIRRHDFAAANRLEKHRYLLYSRAWAAANRLGVAYSDANRKISQSTALVRLESEALDLYEKVSCSWQGQAIAALAHIAPAEDWHLDEDGDVVLPEDVENPGFLIWLDGQRMRLSWGCIDFECDVQRGSHALTARWLMDAAAAWGTTGEE